MNIKSRINALKGFNKSALNLKLFKRIWPNFSRGHPEEGISAEEGFKLYQNGLLSSDLQKYLESYDLKYSLYDKTDYQLNVPNESNIDYEKIRSYTEGRKKRLEEAELLESRERILSGRHDRTSYIPTIQSDNLISFEDESLKTVDPTTGVVPPLERGELEKGGIKWAPYILAYKGSSGPISYRYSDPNKARWVSSHPDLSAGYGRKGTTGILEIYDLRKIPEDKRSFYSKHIGKDSRGKTIEEVMESLPGGKTLSGESPFYEMVVPDKILSEAKIAKYKALPGMGWMLVEGRNILKDGLTLEEAAENKKIFEKEMRSLINSDPRSYYYYRLDKLNNQDLDNYAAENFNQFFKNMAINNPKKCISILKDIKTLLSDSRDIIVDKNEKYSFAIENLAEKEPQEFLDKYVSEAERLGLDIDNLTIKALKSFAVKNPIAFLNKYMENYEILGLDDLVKEAFKTLAINDPDRFIDFKFYKEAKKLGLIEETHEAFKWFSKNYPYDILNYYLEDVKNLGFFDLIDESLRFSANHDPLNFTHNYGDLATRRGLDVLIRDAVERVSNENPGSFILNNTKYAVRFGLDHLIKPAIKKYMISEPDSFLRNYENLSKRPNESLIIREVMIELADERPMFFLSNYLDLAKNLRLYDEIEKTLKIYANKNPRYFIYYYKSLAESLGFENIVRDALIAIGNENNNDILEYRDDAIRLGLGDLISSKELKKKSSLDNESITQDKTRLRSSLFKLAKALYSMGMKKESFAVINLAK